jgi:hypothetical protein
MTQSPTATTERRIVPVDKEEDPDVRTVLSRIEHAQRLTDSDKKTLDLANQAVDELLRPWIGLLVRANTTGFDYAYGRLLEVRDDVIVVDDMIHNAGPKELKIISWLEVGVIEALDLDKPENSVTQPVAGLKTGLKVREAAEYAHAELAWEVIVHRRDLASEVSHLVGKIVQFRNVAVEGSENTFATGKVTLVVKDKDNAFLSLELEDIETNRTLKVEFTNLTVALRVTKVRID